MYAQVIILGNVYFCVVFKVLPDGPHIIAKYSSGVIADLREWLSQNNYPMKGEILRQRNGTNFANGCYIKPYMTDRYYRVHEDNHVEQVNANQFDGPLFAYDGF